MYSVDLYRRVRLACHHEGLSQREAARRFGIDRRTVSKMLLHSEPPGYRRTKPVRKPKLGPFTGIIDQILPRGPGAAEEANAIRPSASLNGFGPSTGLRAATRS